MKSNSVMEIALVGGCLQFTVPGEGAFTFDPGDAGAANRTRAELHGWKQRIADAAAIPRDPETGASATPGEKFAAMKTLAEWYIRGGKDGLPPTDWSRKAGPGGRKPLTRTGEILTALVELGKRADLASAEAAVMALSHKRGISFDEAARLFLGDGEVKAEIARARAARRGAAPGGIDVEGLLAEIDGE